MPRPSALPGSGRAARGDDKAVVVLRSWREASSALRGVTAGGGAGAAGFCFRGLALALRGLRSMILLSKLSSPIRFASTSKESSGAPRRSNSRDELAAW